MARTTPAARAERLILDAGAVIALALSEPRAMAFLRRAVELGADVIIRVVVLAETLRGGRSDASVHRVLNSIGGIESTDPEIGRVAGALLGRSRQTGTVDAMVIAEAVSRGGGQVLTSDPSDLGRLAASDPAVTVHPVAKLPVPPSRH